MLRRVVLLWSSARLTGAAVTVLGGCVVGEVGPLTQPAVPFGCDVSLVAEGATEVVLGVGGQVDLGVVISDSCSGLISGATILFTITTGAELGASLSTPSVPSSAEGVARTTLVAGDRAGALTILARASAYEVETGFAVTLHGDACVGHCSDGRLDCGETGVDCGGDCTACADPCANHCQNAVVDCGETGVDCGGDCTACADPCANHCQNAVVDCGEMGVDCGGECAACSDPCANHCQNVVMDCGETGVDCGGQCPACSHEHDAALLSTSIPASMACGAAATATITMQNTGATIWYRSGSDGFKLGYVGDWDHPLLPPMLPDPRVPLPEEVTVAPGESFTFTVPLRAPVVESETSLTASFRMVEEAFVWFGDTASQAIAITLPCVSGGGLCPAPLPPSDNWQINCKPHGNLIDCTPVVTRACDFCAAIGLGDIDGVPRCGCPVRPDGHPDRVACEHFLLGGAPVVHSLDGGECAQAANEFQFYPRDGACQLCSPDLSVCGAAF